MYPSFEGKVALVTGTAMGMRLATAEAFTSAGASFVLAGFNATALKSAKDVLSGAGHKVHAIVCDLSKETEVETMVAKNIATYGRFDTVFNIAGFRFRVAPAINVPSSDCERVMGINFRGVWDCMRFKFPQMVKQGSGAIVNCSTSKGSRACRTSAYHGSKHGVIGMTKGAALGVAAQGIRIKAVCAGTIDTPVVQDMVTKMPSVMDTILKMQPIGRLGSAEDVAAAVLWLCSDASKLRRRPRIGRRRRIHCSLTLPRTSSRTGGFHEVRCRNAFGTWIVHPDALPGANFCAHTH